MKIAVNMRVRFFKCSLPSVVFFLIANMSNATITQSNVQVKAIDMYDIGTNNKIRVRFLKSNGSAIDPDDGCEGQTWWTTVPSDNNQLLSMLLAAQASKANAHIATTYTSGTYCDLTRFQIDP